MRRLFLASILVAVSCGGSDETPNAKIDAGPRADAAPGQCSGATASVSTPGHTPPAPPALTVPSGFRLETLAAIGSARELVALPNGDLLVGTNGKSVYIVTDAEGTGPAGAPTVFTTIDDAPVNGVAFDASGCTIYVGSEHGIHAIPYADGQLSGQGASIASVRTGGIPPGTDGDVHVTTSVAVGGGSLYAGVGSSCNACTETDGTRASIQKLDLDGAQMTTRATRMRNAIALAVNPATGTLWAGGAGQDNLPAGHPFEYFDAVGLHGGVADYGWPFCEEDHVQYMPGADCAQTVAPIVELPAYSTLIGAAFYPSGQGGSHAFASDFRGGVFIAAHGSWHMMGGRYSAPPTVVFVPLDGDAPRTAVDWSDPSAQWSEFVGGWQTADGQSRIARATGIAVGPQGSLFVGDDQNGRVYRIRPE